MIEIIALGCFVIFQAILYVYETRKLKKLVEQKNIEIIQLKRDIKDKD